MVNKLKAMVPQEGDGKVWTRMELQGSGNAGRCHVLLGIVRAMFPPIPSRGPAARWSAVMSAGAVLLALGLVVALAPRPVTVIDGDTVDRWPYRYRLLGFDAPEIRRARCPSERQRGHEAKARLAELVASAQRVEIVSAGRRDQWGRTLARLEIDGRDLAAIAVAEGWAAPYSGRGPRHDWCAE